MPIVTAIAVQGAAFAFGLTGSIFIGYAVEYALTAGILFAANALLNRKDTPDAPSAPDRLESFSSGPARWILGRRKVGGVVAFWGEDWDVPGTEGRGGPGADDLHLVIAVSEGDCDAIEAIWVAGERLDVKFTDQAKTRYARRGEREGDTEADLALLPLDLDPGAPTYWDPVRERYYEREGGRQLNQDDDNDAELIRRADLSGAVNVYPWLDGSASNRWTTVRTYTDRADTAVLGQATPFTDWTTDHQLKGVAGLHIRLRQWTKHNFDERVFKGGVPALQFLIRGQKITFPDPESSTGTITQWTNNAAAVRYWWHTQRRGIDAENIDRASFVTAYNVCEATITPSLPEEWPNNEPPDWAEDSDILSFRRYSIDGLLTSGESAARIEQEFDDAWQGVVVEEGGSFYYYPGYDRISQSVQIEGSDLLELPSWKPAPALADRVNAVTLSIDQSSFHDFNNHSLREIVDTSKRDEVDEGLSLPQDLGTRRWTINPAQAYSLGTITLRRARSTGTLSVKLPPGTQDDPIAYLAMSPGLIYSVNIADEGFAGARMMLVDKSISAEMVVTATFIEAPLGLYAPAYQLPDVSPRPEFIPSKIGHRPPKPTNLVVTSTAQVSDDGSVYFRIKASVDPSPRRHRFQLTAGDSVWVNETAESEYVFTVNVPKQQMEITARSLDSAGVESLPLRHIFTPDYDAVVLSRPLWEDVIVYGANLRLIFERVFYGSPIAGVEVRYTRLPLGSTGALPVLTTANWETGSVLGTEPIQVVRGLDINVNAVAPLSGRYGLFARFVAKVSGAEPVRGPISYLRDIEVEIPEQPIETIEQAPLFSGASTNLVKWVGQAGSAAGEALLFPSSSPASDLLFDHWNGWVPDSAITAHPLPRWPFGQCEGFGQTLSATRDSFGIITASPATTYTTEPIDLGLSKRVDVKYEIFAYIPGTDRQSNLTFGSHTISDQSWASGAITPITLPEAEQGIGTITYRLTGLPAGLAFTASTRRVTGTPLVSSASGTARYIATDEAGGEAVIEFDWSIGSSVSAPGVPSSLVVNAQQTTARLTWTAGFGASAYDIQRATSSTGPWANIGSTVDVAFDLTGLTASTTYFVRIRAKNGGGESAWTLPLTFTTPAVIVAPGVPTGLAMEARTSSSITVDWTSALGVTSYEVRWKDANLNSYDDDDIATGLFETEHTITGLGSASAYDIQVRARNSAGASDWSTEVEISTLAASYSAPTITSLTAVKAVQDYLLLSIGSYANLNSLEIEVTAEPSDGTHSSVARSYTESPPGPYQIYNVQTGHTYQVRVRAVLQGGVKSVWSAWRSIVFADVPSKIRNLTATSTSTSVTLSWTASEFGSPTSYRVDYWPVAEPTNVLFIDGITGTSQTVTGLDSEIPHVFEVKAINAAGASLGERIQVTTAAAVLTAPPQPSDRLAVVIGTDRVKLTWSDTERATIYDVRHYIGQATDSAIVTRGLTENELILTGLTAGTSPRIEVRARNSAGESDWAQFNAVSMPSEASNYGFDTSAPLTLSKGTGRTLNYSLTATAQSGLAYFLIRYRQNQDALTDDNVVPDWVYLPPINNAYSSGQRTWTGSFDPKYSRRYYEVQVLAYIDTPGGANVGITRAYPCSNSVTLSTPLRTLSSTILAGDAPLTAPTGTVEQSGSNPIIITISWLANRAQFESNSERNSVLIDTVNNTYRNIDQRITSGSTEIRSEGYYLNRNDWLAQRNIQRYKTGDVLRIRNIAIASPRPDVFSFSSYTVVDPATYSGVTPDQIGAISIEREDGDVTFSWDAVVADGYEVRVTENDIGSLDSTLSYVAQTGTGTEYEKIGGRNEHFTISVRAYNGSGSGRLYSTARTLAYAPPSDAHSVGIVTGLEEDPIGNTTRIRWRAVPNADGYQYQTKPSGGSWSTAATTTSTTITIQSAGSFTTRIRGYRGSGSNRVYGLAWSAIAHRAYTNPSGGQVGDVENVVAIDRGNDVVLDWDDVVLHAGRFRIERKAAGAATWTLVQAAISNTTTAWSTDDDATNDATYRIRGETDESNGAWTEIEWTGSTLIPLSTVTNLRAITRGDGVELRWEFPPGIFQVEYRYRKGSTGSWTSALVDKYVKHVNISGLDHNSQYSFAVRTAAGDRRGAWTSINASTLQCITLPAPASVSTGRGSGEIWAAWNAVTGAAFYTIVFEYASSTSGPWVEFNTRTRTGTTSGIATLPSAATAPYYVRIRVNATTAGGCPGLEASETVLIPSTGSDSAQSEAEGAIAAGSGASVDVPAIFEHAESASSSPFARPYFDGYFEERCFVAGSAIEAFEIPAPQGGSPPYTITATGLPAGVTLAGRTISGTPTGSAPGEGFATITLTDSNGAFDRRSIRWILASAAPSGWSEIGGGLGRINNPFQIECTTKGNIRPLLWTGGATNAHDIENDEGQAQGLMVWFRCPTTYAHTARLIGAAAVDFDLVVKVGDDWYFSDTTDNIEFVRAPGHQDGALIGVYRYASTTTSIGSNNIGDPLILEWYPDIIEAPGDNAGDEASGQAESLTEASGANTAKVPGLTDTDCYLLYRNGKTGAWTRRAQPLPEGWTDVGTNAREIRFEFHLKRWENRAVRRITVLHRDRP